LKYGLVRGVPGRRRNEVTMQNLFRKVRLSVSVSAALTFAIGLLLTALLFASVRRAETQVRAARFEQEAALRIAAVSSGLRDAVEQVMVVNALFSTVGAVSSEQFKSFTAPLLARYPEIQALSYQRLLMDQDRKRYEAEMRKRFPDFYISEFVDGKQRPAALRDSYNVVEYIQPYEGNELALGLDTSRTREHAEARLQSRKSGQAASTSLLQLVQVKGFHTGFLVLAPVYMRGAPIDTVALRQRAVVGETAVVFRIDHLIQTILNRSGFLNTPGMATNIFVASSAQQSQLAFRDGVAARPMATGGLLPGWLLYDHAQPKGAGFTIAGAPWYMEVAQAPVPFLSSHGGSLYALLGGLLSSLLAAGAVYSLVSRKSVIDRVTSERTSALRSDNLRLAEDLALRMRTEKSLRLREKVIEVSSNAIIICSANGPDYAIEYVNPAFESITGYSADEVIGKSLRTLQGASQDHQNIEEISAALREQREGHAVLRNYRKDGSGYWNDLYIAPVRDDDGTITNFVVAQYDISAVMRYEAELEFQARHDALTGLANRNLLTERLERAISSARHSGTELWVVFVDLDRFKFVNDTLGHEAGDILLKALAERLKLAVREADTVARMGGDEFVLVLPEGASRDAGMAVIQNIMDAVAKPLMIQSHEFFLTCSIGIAAFPSDGGTADALTKHADIAMYRAKEMGRNTWQFYTPAMSERTLERLEIEADLRHALDRNQFSLHYQPQLDLASGAIVGMEALLRWNHPQHGMISPARFISLAEEMGLIVPIGAWVLRQACAQTKAWHLAGLGELRVAVNLSPRQFTQKGLVQSIAAILYDTGLDARHLELEVTESMVMCDVDHAITILRDLKHLGVQIAIDDFGTGYSSLSYLRRFPIDVLKIDQSFVSEIASATDNAAIVLAIIALAKGLRLKVIAEGVETQAQLAFLSEHGCHEVQGYLFSRAVPEAEFAALVDSGLRVDLKRVAHAHV
jgi:diguanylate cyclase (GGDEF)-like protein/PAS domain S-box-containing protein